jgi:EpsD family peptidyl-prolyl cis-trans isomerase
MNQPRSNASTFARSGVLLVAAAAAVLVLAGCGDRKGKTATQAAARVNKEEVTVHQINFLLQQQRGLKPEQADAASRQILERLIDQELAVQKAGETKLDRDPRVLQQIDNARREILARAYAERAGEQAAKPTPEEIKKYFDANPALFTERRIYSLQELAVEAKPEQVATLREKLAAAKNVGEFVDYLKANEFKFAGNQAVRAAEQLPLKSLGSFAKMRDGQAVLTPTANGAQILVLAGSRTQPVTLEQAKPAIEQFLLNERRRELIAKELKDMRAAAKIEYLGKFAEGAASAAAAAASAAEAQDAEPEPAPAPAVVPTPAPAASGALDDSAISKGLGLKK